MSDKVGLSGNYGYSDLSELKKDFDNLECIDFRTSGEKYTRNESIFGGDDGLQAGCNKDDFFTRMRNLGCSDQNMLESFWELVNLDDSDDIIDDNEFDTLLQNYGWNMDSNGKEIKNPQDYTTITMGSFNVHLTDTIKYDSSSVSDSDATDDKDDNKTSQTMSDIFAQNSKLKQDDDKNWYLTSESWDASKPDNLDCTARIIKNVYGVSYKSDEGQQILEELKKANPEFFANGIETIPANTKLKLIDATEILGLKTDETNDESKTNEKDAQIGTGDGSYKFSSTETSDLVNEAKEMSDEQLKNLDKDEMSELLSFDVQEARDHFKYKICGDSLIDKRRETYEEFIKEPTKENLIKALEAKEDLELADSVLNSDAKFEYDLLGNYGFGIAFNREKTAREEANKEIKKYFSNRSYKAEFQNLIKYQGKTAKEALEEIENKRKEFYDNAYKEAMKKYK